LRQEEDKQVKTKVHILTILILLLSVNVLSQNANKVRTVKWYIPTSLQIQYAGNIGMISAGPSWTIFNNNAALVFSMGYVPGRLASSDIYIAALKAIYTPPLVINIKMIKLKPLALGAVCSYTFGDKFSKYQNTKLYSSDYYWWNTSYRFGFLYIAELYTPINKKYLRGVSIYFEASFWDLYLFSQFDHSNSSYLNLWDISSFGLGSKWFF
jgi:hypothetical protein